MEFEVEFMGYALVRQRRTVEAESLEEAREVALETECDHEWDYQGVEEGTIEGMVSSGTHTLHILPSLSLKEQ